MSINQGDAHEIWAMAQHAPGEGIADAVLRIEKWLDDRDVRMAEQNRPLVRSLIAAVQLTCSEGWRADSKAAIELEGALTESGYISKEQT